MSQSSSRSASARSARARQGKSDKIPVIIEGQKKATSQDPAPREQEEAGARKPAPGGQDQAERQDPGPADQSSLGTAGGEPPKGASPAGPPAEEPPPFSGDENTRRELHAFLGELHGLLWELERNLPRWCPADLQPGMSSAIAETHPAFGYANAELDKNAKAREVLPDRGLAKESLAMKLGRFRRKLAAFYQAAVDKAADLLRPVQDVVRWALIPLDTFASEIPGGTAIKEIFLAINEAAAEKGAGPTK